MQKVRLVREGRRGEVAERLNVSRNSVYLAKSRVLSRMRQLEKELESDW